ncbi:uncharacterized protein N7506_008285 [Penicillium brevicompactum]|uniref:uncharacterized protein n=1 Tax=Penicillium brevicompactum TaxID=5074 RepID=UPI00253F8E1C|nr:uncharacterized protein N7506_008285 [Penicillium brevicompactum]KAJ5325183.1 hypothetical protein N7506_008285 [Penicillium brevicompactum]
MEDVQEDPDWRTEEFESCLRMRPYEEIREMRAREAQLILNARAANPVNHEALTLEPPTLEPSIGWSIMRVVAHRGPLTLALDLLYGPPDFPSITRAAWKAREAPAQAEQENAAQQAQAAERAAEQAARTVPVTPTKRVRFAIDIEYPIPPRSPLRPQPYRPELTLASGVTLSLPGPPGAPRLAFAQLHREPGLVLDAVLPPLENEESLLEDEEEAFIGLATSIAYSPLPGPARQVIITTPVSSPAKPKTPTDAIAQSTPPISSPKDRNIGGRVRDRVRDLEKASSSSPAPKTPEDYHASPVFVSRTSVLGSPFAPKSVRSSASSRTKKTFEGSGSQTIPESGSSPVLTTPVTRKPTKASGVRSPSALKSPFTRNASGVRINSAANTPSLTSTPKTPEATAADGSPTPAARSYPAGPRTRTGVALGDSSRTARASPSGSPDGSPIDTAGPSITCPRTRPRVPIMISHSASSLETREAMRGRGLGHR